MANVQKRAKKKDKLIFALTMPKMFDRVIHFAVLVLILFGTVMILSTNAAQPLSTLGKVFAKQMAFIVASYILLTFFANNFTMRRAYKFSKIAGFCLIGALLATLLTSGTYGSRAWIRIPLPGMDMTIQPSEFSKTFMVVLVAVYVEISRGKNYDFWTIVKIPFLFFIAIVGIVFFQNDTGTAIVLTLMVAIATLIPSHKNLRVYQKFMKIAITTGAVVALVFASKAGLAMAKELSLPEHFFARFQNAIDPFEQPFGDGYQLINGLYGFARGGVTGVGLGESIQKYGFLTQSDNDFILSIVVEETGIFGLSIILIGYCLIIQRLFYYALRSPVEAYKIILIGTAMYIFVHFALNVGGVSGLIPLTGVPLLFISSGGSSLMSIAIAIGISQSVIARIRRQGLINKKKKILVNHHRKEPQGDGVL